MILGLVFLVAALVVYFDFIEPVYGETEQIKAQQLGLENFLGKEKEAISKIQNLINAYQGQGEVRQAVSLAFPGDEDAVGALAQLYGLAQSSGLNLQFVSVSAAGRVQKSASEEGIGAGTSFIKPTGTSVFQIKLFGSYEDLKVFLSRLETNMRIFDLKSLVVEPNLTSTGKLSQTSYNYDLSVATYYQSQ